MATSNFAISAVDHESRSFGAQHHRRFTNSTIKPNIDYKKFWRQQISRVICDSLRTRIRTLERKLKSTDVRDLELHAYLEWRLGYNLLASGHHKDAFPILERATTGGRYGKKQIENGRIKIFVVSNSDVHVAAARCAVHLFINSKDRVFLQKAYAHYQNGVEKMDLFISIARLPPLLFEFSKMLELYGAFDAAYEMHRRILEGFPYYRGYFETMYRSAVVGKHLMSIASDRAERSGFLTVCMESLSFLLEAIPKSISELHVKFLYARCVEAAAESNIKEDGRAHKAYEGFFSKCLEIDLAVTTLDTHATFDKWFMRPSVWLQVADRFRNEDEPLLVEEALLLAIVRCEEIAEEIAEARGENKPDEHIKKDTANVRNKMKGNEKDKGKEKSREKEKVKEKETTKSSMTAKEREKFIQNKKKLYDSTLHLDAYMKMARLQLSFANKVGAAGFAEKAFAIEHCRADVRALLAECNEGRRVWMENEDRVFRLIAAKWRQRFMTKQFITRVKQLAIIELEQKLNPKKIDKKLRESLAYYARDQYRAKFMFENVCAIRIQRMFRTKRFIWLFLNCVRANYRALATQACVQLNKTPWNPLVRKEIRRIARHRLCPPEHRIKKVMLRIDRQDVAANVIRKAVKAFQIRLVIWTRVARTRARIVKMMYLAARTIQCVVRVSQAREKVAMKRLRDETELQAAIRIQRFFRWRLATFQHSVSRLLSSLRDEKSWAEETLKYVLGYFVIKRVKQKRAAIQALLEQIAREKRREELRRNLLWKNQMAVRITMTIRRAVTIRTVKVAKLSSKGRKQEGRWSMLCKNISLIEDYLSGIQSREDQFSGADITNINSRSLTSPPPAPHSSSSLAQLVYRPPGISPGSPQFINALNRKTTVCLGGSFSSVDCMMLGNVMRHADCKIQQLVFVNIVTYTNTGAVADGDEDTEFGASFGFDLLPAIARCRTLRSVRIFGGSWPSPLLEKIFAVVQVENVRIQDFRIEGLQVQLRHDHNHTHNHTTHDIMKSGALTDSISSAAGRLLCDYFNYKLPGLRSLCLHGCSLKDHHLELISEGMSVNSGVTDLALSNNLITDDGLLILLGGISKNKSGALRRLSVECNLIRYRYPVRAALQLYTNPCNNNADPTTRNLMPTAALEVHLLNNPILLPYKLSNPEVVVCFSESDVRKYRAKLKADEDGMKDCLLHRPGASSAWKEEKIAAAGHPPGIHSSHGTHCTYCSEHYSLFLESPSSTSSSSSAIFTSPLTTRNKKSAWPRSSGKRVRLQGL